jgi:hypothetical protein
MNNRLFTIVNIETGEVLYCKQDREVPIGLIAISEMLTDRMREPYFDFKNRIFYDKNPFTVEELEDKTLVAEEIDVLKEEEA